MVWAIEVCRKSGLPVVASMCIGPEGDLHGNSAGECAVQMAKAGAHVGRSEARFVHAYIPSVAIRHVSGGGR